MLTRSHSPGHVTLTRPGHAHPVTLTPSRSPRHSSLGRPHTVSRSPRGPHTVPTRSPRGRHAVATRSPRHSAVASRSPRGRGRMVARSPPGRHRRHARGRHAVATHREKMDVLPRAGGVSVRWEHAVDNAGRARERITSAARTGPRARAPSHVTPYRHDAPCHANVAAAAAASPQRRHNAATTLPPRCCVFVPPRPHLHTPSSRHRHRHRHRHLSSPECLDHADADDANAAELLLKDQMVGGSAVEQQQQQLEHLMKESTAPSEPVSGEPVNTLPRGGAGGAVTQPRWRGRLMCAAEVTCAQQRT